MGRKNISSGIAGIGPLTLARVFTALLAATALGCSGEPEQGRLVIHTLVDGETISSSEARLDFGEGFVGTKVERRFWLANEGGTAIDVALGERDPATHGDEPIFEVRFAPVRIEPGKSVVVHVTFHARARLEKGVHDALATLRFVNLEDRRTVSAIFSGRTLGEECAWPKVIDVGTVQAGLEKLQSIGLVNPFDRPIEVAASLVRWEPEAFEFDDGSLERIVRIPARGSETVALRYLPKSPGAHRASLELSSAACGVRAIELNGRASSISFSFDDGTPDCGAVPVGKTRTKTLNFQNASDTAVRITDFRTSREEFRFLRSELEVPPTGTTSIAYECSPRFNGSVTGHLTFRMDVPEGMVMSFGVKLFGGSPTLTLDRSQVDFDRVPRTSGAGAFWELREQLVLKNSAPAGGPNPLRFSSFELTPANPDTQAGEFEASFSEAFDPSVGLAPGATTSLQIWLRPKAAGLKEAVLTIWTNEFDRPYVQVPLRAEVVTMPSCQAIIDPGTLDFGRVSRGSKRQLSVAVTNAGTSPCLMRLVGVSGAGYSASRSNRAIELAPGQRQLFPVGLKVGDVSPGDVLGELEILVSSDSPRVLIPLRANVGQVCLFAAPTDFDFGSIRSGCASETRTLRLYNSCSQDVNIVSVELSSALPVGCADPSCAEFVIAPEIEWTGKFGGELSPLRIPVRYAPTDLNQDLAFVQVTVNENELPVRYVLSLRGKGATDSLRREVFATSNKADVLFTIEDAGGLASANVLGPMSREFASFTDFANATGSDWQFGVTTSTLRPVQALVSGAGHEDRVLTPETLNLAAQWAAKVQVGSAGSAFEHTLDASIAALSPPAAQTDNDGFLRDDASVGILGVTNSPDHTTRTAEEVVDRLFSIKGFNRLNDLSFSIIGPMSSPSTCVTEGSDYGGLFRSTRTRTGGLEYDVCAVETASASIMKRVGERTMGLRSQYFLSAIPQRPDEIEVTTASGPLPAEVPGLGTAWSYDPVSNAIHFNGGFEPIPGDGVAIEYGVSCHAP